jgi:hypothetical protein
MYLQKVISKKNIKRKKLIFVDVLKVTDENSRIRIRTNYGSISSSYGSADLDPYQNFTDPQHCCKTIFRK